MLSFQNANVPGDSPPSPGPWESWTVSWLQRGNHLPSCRLDNAFLLDKADELPQTVTPTARWLVWPVVPESPLRGASPCGPPGWGGPHCWLRTQQMSPPSALPQWPATTCPSSRHDASSGPQKCLPVQRGPPGSGGDCVFRRVSPIG